MEKKGLNAERLFQGSEIMQRPLARHTVLSVQLSLLGPQVCTYVHVHVKGKQPDRSGRALRQKNNLPQP